MKNSDFIFFNKIEGCHLNNHSPKNEINVARTFRDIHELGTNLSLCHSLAVTKIRKVWDRIYGDDVTGGQLIMKPIFPMHSFTSAYVIRHSNRA